MRRSGGTPDPWPWRKLRWAKQSSCKLNRSGSPPRRLATGGRSAADGKRCSGARTADRDSSSVLRRVARRIAGQPQECGATAGIGGGCGQNRGLWTPPPWLRRRSGRRQNTRQVPTPAPEWPPARPPPLCPLGSHSPLRRPLLRLMRRSVRRQGTRRVSGEAPKWRPARPAHQRPYRSHPPSAGRELRRRERQANWQMIGGESTSGDLERRSSRSTIHREPCVGVREDIGEASVAVRTGRASNVERTIIWVIIYLSNQAHMLST